jgi:hypothetical protein
VFAAQEIRSTVDNFASERRGPHFALAADDYGLKIVFAFVPESAISIYDVRV